MKTENYSEQFVKYSKVLKIYIPQKISKKTQELIDWFANIKDIDCYFCGRKKIILIRRGTLNFTKVCSNGNCVMFINFKKIGEWMRAK